MRLGVSVPVKKISRLEIQEKYPGLENLPGCPARVCPVIARFLAGGQLRLLRGPEAEARGVFPWEPTHW